jgi:hypothetical protein
MEVLFFQCASLYSNLEVFNGVRRLKIQDSRFNFQAFATPNKEI